MYSCDTNIFLYSLDSACKENQRALFFLDEVKDNKDFIVCDLVLIELFILLQNNKVLKKPYSNKEASEICFHFRNNPAWKVLEYSNGIMDNVWQKAKNIKPAHRIFDLRLGYCLLRAGVESFYTRNIKDFSVVGFKKVINPID